MTAIDLGPVRSERDEAALRERPSEVLPDPSELIGTVVADTETTGLFCDDGATIAATSVAYRIKSDPDHIYYHAFPFDQGRAADKGFTTLYYPDSPTYRKRGHVGKPKGDPDGEWDWDTDYNLDKPEWDAFINWLYEASKRNGLTGANIKFDLHHFQNGTRHWKGRELEKFVRWDTQLANGEIWPGTLTGLKPTAMRLWGAEEGEEAGEVKRALIEVKKRYGLTQIHGPHYDLMPWEVNGPYAGQDAVLTKRLEEYQYLMLDEGIGSRGHLHDAVQLLRVLYRMERRGLGPVDVAKADAEARRIEKRLAELEPSFPFQPPTAAQASEYYFEELGLQPWNVGGGEEPRTKEIVPDRRKGKPAGATRFKITKQGTLNEAVALRMGEAGVPHAADYAEYLRLKVLNQMFYRNYATRTGADGYLRTSFKQGFVKSGRMSVERFQAQAIPKKVAASVNGEKLIEPRGLFLVDEGRTRLGLDLNQAELRIAAMLCECESMLTLLRSGGDLHGNTTRKTFHVDTDDPRWDELRDIGKRLTFGSIFQIGPKTFRETLWKDAAVAWTYAECADAVYSWRDTYPEFGQAYEYWMRYAERHKHVMLVDHQPSWLLGPADWSNTAWSRVVQSSLGLFVRRWLIEVEKMTARYGALKLTVHDSVLLDLPNEVHDQMRDAIVKMTEEMWFEWFNMPGGCSVSPFLKAG